MAHPETKETSQLLPGLSWEQGLASLLEILPVGFCVIEVPSGNIVLMNQEGEYLLGKSIVKDANLLTWSNGGYTFQMNGDPYPVDHLPFIKALRDREERSADDVVVRHDHGQEVVLWIRAVPLQNQSKNIVALMTVFQDITKLKETEEHLHQLSQFDELTQLPNRRGFESQAKREFERSRHAGSPVSILMVDLDHFKQINDRYGHLFGDAALKELAATMRSKIRPTDLVCRWGGEEFAILAAGSTLDDARSLGERVREAVYGKPVQSMGVRHRCSISVGVAALKSEATLEELMNGADARLYEAKHAGRNCVR
jgi:diguanylate cyclase (GGDEF)-like protein